MALSRRLGTICIVGASWLVAVGCDDNDDQVFPRAGAGEGGEAPGGGKSSVAGSQSHGGKASAGSAGEGGINPGGAGGDAGSGGTPGEAGQAGAGETAGAGGESPGGAGGAGGASGGQGGSSGEGGTPSEVAASCSFTCANDEACVIGQNNDSFKCNPVSHRCEDPTKACTSDAECLPTRSFWTVHCADDSECTPTFEACVEANGQGFCASISDPEPDPCFGGGVPRTLPRFGASGSVQVCADADPRCFAGECGPGCGDPDHACGKGNGNACSAATGLCECAQPSECTKTGVCGGDGHCTECANDEDCAATVALTGLGVCVAGKCGCANPTTCVNPGYATATAACQ
jgi:hypothetical protein